MAIKENAQIVRKWLKDQEFHYAEKTFDDGVVTFKMSMSSDSGVYDSYDVTLVCRETDVQSIYHPPTRLNALEAESEAKGLNRAKIGF